MIKREIPKRSYTGEKWKTNPTNKKHLALDFKHRCAYCDDLDSMYSGKETYAVEHFAPKEKFPQLRYTYDNLLYSCSFCNGAKNDDWPSDDPKINVVGERGYIDPCDEEYYKHLDRDENTGKIIYKTPLGEYMFNHLKLYLKRHEILYMMDKLLAKIDQLKESIEVGKQDGKDVSDEEKILNECNASFVNYYGLIAKGQ